jgi:hypothetical protein
MKTHFNKVWGLGFGVCTSSEVNETEENGGYIRKVIRYKIYLGPTLIEGSFPVSCWKYCIFK